MFYKDARSIYRVSELDAFPWLVHGFGTRIADIPSLFGHLTTLKQIHSSVCVAAGGRSGVLGEGDALLENTPGSVVAVKTADCIPILLIDERNRAVAAVHAGWRGTAARIAVRAVEAMQARFGTLPGDLHAAIGPGIGKCCFEVGPEVAAEFGGQGRGHIDLPEVGRRQLLDAGVAPKRIYASNLCTMCRADEFHSFRRDGKRPAACIRSPAFTSGTLKIEAIDVHLDLSAMRTRSSSGLYGMPELRGKAAAGSARGCSSAAGSPAANSAGGSSATAGLLSSAAAPPDRPADLASDDSLRLRFPRNRLRHLLARRVYA